MTYPGAEPGTIRCARCLCRSQRRADNWPIRFAARQALAADEAADEYGAKENHTPAPSWLKRRPSGSTTHERMKTLIQEIRRCLTAMPAKNAQSFHLVRRKWSRELEEQSGKAVITLAKQLISSGVWERILAYEITRISSRGRRKLEAEGCRRPWTRHAKLGRGRLLRMLCGRSGLAGTQHSHSPHPFLGPLIQPLVEARCTGEHRAP